MRRKRPRRCAADQANELAPLHCRPEAQDKHRIGSGLPLEGANVRFWPLADITSCSAHVRFTPNSDRESGHPQTAMSALPPKADMCTATAHVSFGPIADIARRRRAAGAVGICRAPSVLA